MIWIEGIVNTIQYSPVGQCGAMGLNAQRAAVT